MIQGIHDPIASLSSFTCTLFLALYLSPSFSLSLTFSSGKKKE